MDGSIIIGDQTTQSDARFYAANPNTGKKTNASFSEATLEHVQQACELASNSASEFASISPNERADFLEMIAQSIIDIGDLLIETAMSETGLPRARLEGERMRTANQLRLFANHLRAGDWLDITIDTALPERTPPRSDLRRMNHAIGPVAVFGASNFPLAFSVAGGDTASALAAGCPVIVKGHPAHPATGELVARAIANAIKASNLPNGIFSYLPGTSNDLGGALVSDARIKAVGFTGSRAGGIALSKIAAQRDEPIPVYAEMSAINPVLLLPAALAENAESLGKAFISSLTMGAGQFCTNPGLILAIDGPDFDKFTEAASSALSEVIPPTMLSSNIHSAYHNGVEELENNARTTLIARGQTSNAPNSCRGALFQTDAQSFLADKAIGHEVFGASAVLVKCKDEAELLEVIAGLEGQLTATLHANDNDSDLANKLLPVLTTKVGRVLANGWPTGVEVSDAMVHGGPFPATSDTRTTSVGTLAIARFLRPVCYQDIPDDLLPNALKNSNPWQLPRTINSKRVAS